MDAMQWDLRARGPVQSHLGQFLEVDKPQKRPLYSEQSESSPLSTMGTGSMAIAVLQNNCPEASSMSSRLLMKDRLRYNEEGKELVLSHNSIPEGMVAGYDLVK